MNHSEVPVERNIYFETRGIDKQYPGVHAVDAFSLAIKKGEILGLAGENGAGKSTLLKIIAGVEHPDSGVMLLKGKEFRPRSFRHANMLGVSMVFQEQNLVPNLRVYENMFLSHEEHFQRYGVLNRKALIARAKEYLETFELDINPNRPLSRYSFHQRQMLEIIRAFVISDMYGVETPLILLDEPTAALPDEERELLIEKIRVYAQKAVIVFVSHRLSELTDLCTRIAVLRDGELVGEVTPSTSTEKDIHKLMVGRELSADLYRVEEQGKRDETQEAVLNVEGLSVKGEYEEVNLEVYKGEIVGIGGLLGSGKKELGESLFGIGKTNNGTITINGIRITHPTVGRMIRHRVGYVPAERKQHGVIYLLPVGWNISITSLRDLVSKPFHLLSKKKEDSLIDEAIARFGIKARKTDPCYSLSGGNQQKVVLAKWMVKNLDILILDNPTRGIDVGAKEEIYTFIREMARAGLAIVLITDDLLELIGLSNRIIIMKDGAILAVRDAASDNKPSEEELVKHMV
ncbi:MAG: sugar ABC transporter ATP-binding protein [Dehalococcoidia bacterium]|nr:sugar ABC transporter ATP-binding protein [Dehalococcoidia bacterium]